jgi:hypothetical protein
MSPWHPWTSPCPHPRLAWTTLQSLVGVRASWTSLLSTQLFLPRPRRHCFHPTHATPQSHLPSSAAPSLTIAILVAPSSFQTWPHHHTRTTPTSPAMAPSSALVLPLPVMSSSPLPHVHHQHKQTEMTVMPMYNIWWKVNVPLVEDPLVNYMAVDYKKMADEPIFRKTLIMVGRKITL